MCKRLDMTNVHEQGVPGLLFMLGTMSSRRVNVPAKRSTWVAESAAGILNVDRTHILATCYMLLSALHFADNNMCHSWHDDDAEGRDPNPSTHSIPWVWNEGPKPIPFWARNLAHDDDLMQFVKVSSCPVCLPLHQFVSSQSVCVSSL